jgi:hypothetical protein
MPSKIQDLLDRSGYSDTRVTPDLVKDLQDGTYVKH